MSDGPPIPLRTVSNFANILRGQLNDLLSKAARIDQQIQRTDCGVNGEEIKQTQKPSILEVFSECTDLAAQLHQILDSIAGKVGD